MSDLTSDDPEAERTSERPRAISAPPPDFDDGPGGETKQTPKDELARWRRMAARGADRAVSEPQDPQATREANAAPGMTGNEVRGSDEVTRAISAPDPRDGSPGVYGLRGPVAPPPAPMRRIEPPTREIELASDMLALSRGDPTGPLPPRHPSSAAHSLPPSTGQRQALWPIAGSMPPDPMPPMPTPAIGVSLPAGVNAARPSRAPQRGPTLVAAAVILLALGGAGALLLWPREDPFAAPVSPSAPAMGSSPTSSLVPSVALGTPPTVSAPTVSTPTVSAPTVSAPTVPAPTVPAPTVPAPTVPAPTPTAPVAPAPIALEAPPEPTAPPSPPAVTEGLGAAGLVAMGDEALEARDFAHALDLFEDAIELDSHNPYASAGAARACLALSRPDDAVRHAARAVANRQRRAMFRVLLGDAHRAAGATDRARAEYERALELDPDDATARARLAE